MATPRFACHSDADIEAISTHCYFSVKIVKLFIKYVEELISFKAKLYLGLYAHETIHV
jgi:hypothetical protein